MVTVALCGTCAKLVCGQPRLIYTHAETKLHKQVRNHYDCDITYDFATWFDNKQLNCCCKTTIN